MAYSIKSAASALVVGLGLVAAGQVSAQIYTEDQRPSACHKKYDDTGPGRDVIYVPTRLQTVERMLDYAEVKAGETVVDLGSGDGRIVLGAARRGANARGIELDDGRFKIAGCWAEETGLQARAKFLQVNIFEHNFTDAQVVTMYLLPGLNLKLRPQLLDMKPGTRVVSHAFTMGDWEADRTESVAGSNQTIYLWIVPAKVEGNWTWELPLAGTTQTYDLISQQQYQVIDGFMRVDNRRERISDARLSGDQISFVFDMTLTGVGRTKHEFAGKVNGNQITGTVKVSLPEGKTAELPWTAKRVPASGYFRPTGIDVK